MTYYVEIWDAIVPERWNGLSQDNVVPHKQRMDITFTTDLTTKSRAYAMDRREQLWARGQSARVVDYLGHRVEEK